MFNRGKVHVISFNYRTSATKEQKLRTTCRALIGFVHSLTKYEHNIIGSDLSINVFNDHKPILTSCAEKGNLSPKKILCTNAIDQIFKKNRMTFTKGKSFR